MMQDLEALSSAEEFFAYFDLDYDPRVLAAARFHILKRFHDNIAVLTPENVERDAYREELRRAYDAYVSGPALGKGAFPALERIHGAFVPLAKVGLRRST
jgi:nitrogenase-stabilizing/protective protein